MKMKIIPVYLPQFHTIPENDKWWGKGFTEWVNVRNAEPLFEGHYQPRVPLNDNYYDLSDVETLKWQCKLAKDHGIYGFCMYHYWFNGHLLLQKPMEMLLAHPEIDIKYCISWANHDWTDGWKSNNKRSKVLIAHNFDDEKDWEDHFNYMLPFFKDKRYMLENNKPLLAIYVPNLIRKLNKMLATWERMARAAGFDGMTFIYQSAACCFDDGWDRSKFSYGIETNPGYVNRAFQKQGGSVMPKLMKYSREIKRLLHIRKSLVPFNTSSEVEKIDYDEIWNKILQLRPKHPNMIPSAFVDWDNTPRYKNNGYVYIGVNPEKFRKYFRQLVKNAKEYYHSDTVFVFAWNEWGEGGYLEPDKRFGYGYLEAIRDVVAEEG